jgi:chromosome segregation ATPase
MENGRCYRHGGATGAGKSWHVTDFSRVTSESKLQRKLRDQRKTAKKRAARLAAMAPDERERHEAWQRSHRPGSKSARAAARQQRSAAKEIAAALAALKPTNSEVERLQREIDRLSALAAAGTNEHDIFG